MSPHDEGNNSERLRVSAPEVIALTPLPGGRSDGNRGSKWRLMGRLAIAAITLGGVLLAMGALAAMLTIFVNIGKDSSKEIAVTDHQDAATLREESKRVFGEFDAAAWDRGELGTSSNEERDEIQQLFNVVAECAQEEDHDHFKTLVDFDRLLKRCEATGNMFDWSYFDKRSWRAQMRASSEAELYWAKINVVGIVAPADDADSRIIYAFCEDSDAQDKTECRFWIARDGDEWKIYDWERLDLGLSKSREWGIYAKYQNSDSLQGFERWGDTVGEVDDAIERGDMDEAKEKLRRAERERMPPEFQDFHYVLTAYRWDALGDRAEAERCYEAVARPLETPSAYYGLLECKRWSEPAEALRYAELYEEAIGPSPGVLEVKAQLLSRLNRDAEAADEWRRLLRMKLDHAYAASEFVMSLPLDDRAEFESALDGLDDPEKVLANVAGSIAMQDYERFQWVAQYIDRKMPGSATAFYAAGMAHFLDGRYTEAAEMHRKAIDKASDASDEEARATYMDNYLDAMAANGKVVEAIRTLPDPKLVFESLYDRYDESEIALSDDEYRQVVALHRELAPTDLNALYRVGNLAVTDERYAEAEQVLRKGLEIDVVSDEEDEDQGYYHDSCESVLTTAVYKQGRWKEAYERIGERRKQFAALAQLMARDRRWELLRELLALHRAGDGDDPKIDTVQGELALHEERWDDAVGALRKGLKSAEGYDQWAVRRKLVEAYSKSGNWIDYLNTSSEPAETFEALSDEFIDDENWDATDKLLAAYRGMNPDDKLIGRQEAEVAWHREDYDAYARLIEPLLQDDEQSLTGFDRTQAELRFLSALLRTGQFDRAKQRAVQREKKDNNSFSVAKVAAAAGDFGEAQRVALDVARKQKGGQAFYTDEDTGAIFLGDEFSTLHREFPVGYPYSAANTLAVFVFDHPFTLGVSELHAAIEKLGIEVKSEAEAVEVSEESVEAYVLKQGGGAIWLAAGPGPFDSRWELERKDEPLADTLKTGQGWLVVGTAGTNDREREAVEALARELAAQLVGSDPIAAYMRGDSIWEHAAYRMTPELVEEWRTRGKLESFEDEASPLRAKDNQDVAQDRDFERSIREQVRAFEQGTEKEFEVVSYVCANPRIGPLRLNVKKVRRTYGGLEFDGELVDSSALIPGLRKGLPMRFYLGSVQESQLGDQRLVRSRR